MRKLAIPAGWQSGRVPCGARANWRFVHRLIRELESPPVNRDHYARVQRAKRGDRFLRVHMEVAHEPAWLVRSDRYQGDIERTAALADGAELRMIARVTREIRALTVAAREREAAPERVPTVADPTATEMLRWGGRDPNRPDAPLPPPIELDDRSRASSALEDEGRETKRHDPRRLRMGPRQALHRPRVEMVVVVVRFQDDIERRKIFERDPRRHPAPGAGKLDRRCSLAPHRVGENVETVELDEEARVSRPRHRELRVRSARRDKIGRDAHEHGWIGILGSGSCRAIHEHPLEEAAEPRHGVIDPWIAKATAGTVVWRDDGRSHGAEYSRAVTRGLRRAVGRYVDDERVHQCA